MKTNQLAWLTSVVAFLMIFGWSLKATAQIVQYVTLNSSDKPNGIDFPVQTNQIISLTGYDWFHKPSLTGNFPDGTVVYLNPYGAVVGSSYSSVVSQIPQTFTGLTNINVNNYGGQASWATFQITTPTSVNVVSNYVPADAIVIPSSATGNVQIILESSTDLVNWTAASPGTYGASSATNRFFRVRAVHN